jgi:hypothetical protein
MNGTLPRHISYCSRAHTCSQKMVGAKQEENISLALEVSRTFFRRISCIYIFFIPVAFLSEDCIQVLI